ncbi:putative membrane protein [Halobacteriovorax marinus SJ]|uniref:Membrane protein n=1 Tax=Halobacteriovorax marinus (strain ATCC BAA-682 / DSM 15412 / SJ) TaxID=862908 RepID=E1X0D2_HALMS|nr:FecR domain-containing protein [Halobacteriovorax marinus]CBW26360.1 putative membrane protein [Halobacteriovorax marinus SJ]
MHKIIFCILFLSLNFKTLAKVNIASVSKIRGNVSVLSPGDHKAHRLKLNDQLAEDASVVTYKNSFVRIVFKDGSSASLGPMSKLIVTKMDEKGEGIITLLKGQLRSKVSRSTENKKKHKFLVRTKSAALGVRGTEFQTIYNPSNNITNLLTYEGEVAISKGEHRVLAGRSYEERASALSSNKLSRSQKHRLKNKLTNVVENSLNSEKAVVVKGGQFSSSIGGVKSATLPVNISPTQLNILYANADLVENQSASDAVAIVDDSKPSTLKIVQQDAPKEGLYDKSSSKYAQKSGGFIDIKSGLYIPPAKDSEFSHTKKTYIAKNVGGIDPVTGQYIAPKGLALDAERGFVSKDSGSDEQRKRSLAQAKALNDVIEKDVVIKNHEYEKPVRVYSQLELFTKDSISVQLSSISNKIEHSNSNTTANKVFEESGKGLSVGWNHSSSGKWQPVTNFHFKNIRFSSTELTPFSQGSSNLFGVDIGMRRYLSERFNFSALLRLHQNFYTAASEALVYRLQKSTFTNLEIGGQFFIIKSKRYDIDISLAYAFAPSKTARDVEIESSSMLSIGGGFRYWANDFLWLKLNALSQSTSYDIKSSHYTATDDNSMFNLGLEIGFVL